MAPNASNPVSINLPAHNQIQITANANAAYTQLLSVSVDGVELGQFIGTGENVPMMTLAGQKAISLSASPQPRVASFLFQYQPPKGPPLSASVKDPIINQNAPFTMITVTSEDSTDNDNNDTYLSIFCYDVSPPSDVKKLSATDKSKKALDSPTVSVIEVEKEIEGKNAVNDTETTAMTATSNLSLHAKVYLDLHAPAGDEYYITVNVGSSNNNQFPTSGSSTGWTKVLARATDDRTSNPLYNILAVAATFTDSDYPELQGAYLVLTTWTWYVLNPPTGSLSVTWTAELYGSNYKVTRVTN